MDGVLVEGEEDRRHDRARVERRDRAGRISLRRQIGSLLVLDPADVQREAECMTQTRHWLAGVEQT